MPKSSAGLAVAAEIPVAPLARFAIAPENPRSIRPKESIEALAANLKANGQLSAVICYEEKGKLWITVGGTRYLAAPAAGLPGLAYDVRAKAQAIDAGLAEQEGHAPLHPADQAAAFAADLVRLNPADDADRRLCIIKIANKVGKTSRFVEQRLAIAELHKPILAALRTDKITVHVAEAWANADVERQEDLWKGLSAERREILEARDIKELIDKADLADNDRLVKFVGKDAIAAAGGAFRQDLFEIEERYSWEKSAKGHVERKIVQKLAREKLAAARERLEKEGWGEVDTTLTLYRSWQLKKGVECKTKAQKAKRGVRISIGETGKLIYERGLPLKAAKAKASGVVVVDRDHAAEEKAREAHQRITGIACHVVGRAFFGRVSVALAALLAAMSRSLLQEISTHEPDLFDMGLYTNNEAPFGLSSDVGWKQTRAELVKLLKPHKGDLETFIHDKMNDDDRGRLLAFLVASLIDLNDSPEHPDKAARAQLATLGRLAGAAPAGHTAPKVADALASPLMRELLGLPALAVKVESNIAGFDTEAAAAGVKKAMKKAAAKKPAKRAA